MTDPTPEGRRPLKTRATGWAQGLARAIARAGVSPDLLSALSVGFAAMAWAALATVWTRSTGVATASLLFAAVCIQLRLLVNMLDGMVAVEHGRGSPLGPIWNELPDRIADVLFLAGAGYALSKVSPTGLTLGWTAAVLAVLTAYVRELGSRLGHPADFCGPGAKPHRMFVLTVGCVVAAILTLAAPRWAAESLWFTLLVIVVLTAITLVRRTLRLAARMRTAG